MNKILLAVVATKYTSQFVLKFAANSQQLFCTQYLLDMNNNETVAINSIINPGMLCYKVKEIISQIEYIQ